MTDKFIEWYSMESLRKLKWREKEYLIYNNATNTFVDLVSEKTWSEYLAWLDSMPLLKALV